MKMEYRRHLDNGAAPWQLVTNIDELMWNGEYFIRVSNDNGSSKLPFPMSNDETATLVVKDYSHEGKLQRNRKIVQEISKVEQEGGKVLNYTRVYHEIYGTNRWGSWEQETNHEGTSSGDNKEENKIQWTSSSYLDTYTTAGIYDITGERTNDADGLPLANAAPGHTFHARLLVLDSSIAGSGKDTDKCITQILSLSNRTGGDGNVYTRTGRAASKNLLAGGSGWGPWGKLQQNVEVGQVTSLDSFTDNGIYSGVYTGDDTHAETFVMVVINNYAVAAETGNIRSVSQYKHALNIDGTFSQMVRTGQGNTGISWGAWTDFSAAGIQDGAITAQKLSNELNELINKSANGAYWTYSPNTVTLNINKNDGTVESQLLSVATEEGAGVMSAEDKTSLTQLIDNAEGKTIDIASLVYESNKYITAAGEIKSQSGFFISAPVLLTQGSKVTLYTNSTNVVSVIARTTKEGDFFSCVAVGKSGNNTYEWIAPIDCYIRLTVTAKQGTIELKGLTEKVKEITTDVYGNSYGVKSVYGIVKGAFLSNGNIGYVDSYSRSNPIPVKEGDVVKMTGVSSTTSISLVTSVSEDNEYLSTIMSGASGVKEFEYSVAADGYISVSMSTGSYTDESAVIITKGLVDEIEKIKEHSGSLWSGKRIMAIGASLTASTKKTNWQYVVGDLLDCNIRTHAKGGIGLIAMVDGDGTEKPEADPDNFGVENIYRLEADDVADVDMILVFGAYNEYRKVRDSYGEMTDMYPEQNTYIGRLRYVASRLVETVLAGNPKCKIAFIEPFCFGGGSYCDATGYDVGVDMARGMQEVASEFCFPCIPLLRNSQIARYNWDLFCKGGGTENTTYLPYDASIPYGTPSIFPSADDLPLTATEGIIALVASSNSYGYTYSRYTNGAWKHGITPWSSDAYPPYMYLWKDFIHLNKDGQERVGQYIAGQVNAI